LRVRTFGSGPVNDDKALTARVAEVIDFRLAAIVRDMQLQKLPATQSDDGFYQRLAVYGHMGRTDLDVPWEKTDKAKALK
jgi:S-adenosylmethionine synthetase